MEQAREATGWELAVAEPPRVTEAPNDEELAALRELLGAMSEAYIYEAVRTPFGRFGGALAGVRPTTSRLMRCVRCSTASADLDPARDRRRLPRRRQRRGRGQPQRRADGGAARRTADLGHRRDGQPPVRIEPRGGDPGDARDPLRRRGARRRRRGRVDEPRPVGSPQARHGPIRAATRRSTRPRSGGGWSTRRCPNSGRSRSAQSAEKLADMYTISREEQDAFALRSHRLAAQAYEEGS